MADEGFKVKGKPNINLSVEAGGTISNLKLLLEQKAEEVRQKEKSERKIVTVFPGSEFKPENMPFIPDVHHAVLTKHANTTEERAAGFQDMSQVPREFAGPIMEKRERDKAQAEKDERDRAAEEAMPTITVETTLMPATRSTGGTSQETSLGTKSETKSCPQPVDKPVDKPKQEEFRMKITHENMNKGGFYMPNESRPYRPGD